jgi:hypothetical protein
MSDSEVRDVGPVSEDASIEVEGCSMMYRAEMQWVDTLNTNTTHSYNV